MAFNRKICQVFKDIGKYDSYDEKKSVNSNRPEETQMIKLVDKNGESYYLLNTKESRGKEESVRERNE